MTKTSCVARREEDFAFKTCGVGHH